MPKDNESTMKWKVDITQLKASMQDAKRSISLANAEFKAATAGMDKWQNSTTGLEAKIKQLNSTLPQQKSILAQLEQQYKLTAENMGENSAEAQRLKVQIENQKASIARTESSISTYNRKLKEMQDAESALTNVISKQESELADLKTAYVNAVAQYGKNSKEAKSLANQISSLSGELAENKTKANEASEAADKLDKSIDNVGDSAEEATDDVGSLNEGFTVMKGMMANLAAEAVTSLINGLKELGKVLIDTGKQAIMSYADYEQLVGGVETLFGAGGMTIEEYAKSVGKTVDEVKDEYDSLMTAQESVLANASQAFKTAGLSQNEYMETVTSFSASLISSLGGDTAKAAEIADLAITDMSDNANKMGTSMTDIQNAYQGFAKQNYTMLDNLKLGYGGTKTEMERLIADANKLKEAQGEVGDLTIESYADIIEAIHLVQDEMGITGTTMKEASSTITGSLNMTKAAWSNLLTGMADDNADFEKLIDDFVESAMAFAGNILPRIKTVISGMGQMISGLMKELIPQIIAEIPPLIQESVPILLEALGSMVQTIAEMLPDLVTAFADIVPQLIDQLVSGIPDMMDAGADIAEALINGASQILPRLITVIPTLITNFISGITRNLPKLIQAGITLLQSLLSGLISAIPQLVQAIPYIVTTLLTAITEQLPLIIEAGVTLVMSLIQGLTEALPLLISYIPMIIQSIVDTIMPLLPQILDAGVQILMSLIDGIISMIPQLIEYLPTIIQTICTVLTENLPQIVEMGIMALISLINGLVTAIPQLISYLPTIISTIVNVLTENFPLILQAGIQILMMLIQGLIQTIPELIKMLPQIIGTIIQVLTENLPKILQMGADILWELITGIGSLLGDLGEMMAEVGKAIIDAVIELPSEMLELGANIVEGIWNGISDGYDWICKKISGWVDNVVDFIMDAFGVNSPSKVMRDQVGKWLPEGIAVGFEKDMPQALKDMKKSVNSAISELKTDVALQTDGIMGGVNLNGSSSGSLGSGTSTQNVTFNQTINSPKAVDRMTLYRETNSLLFSAKVRLANV